MRNRVNAIALLVVSLTASVRGQSPSAPLAFDVVSVKPNTSGEVGGASRAQPGRYQGVNVTLMRVIGLAYRPVQEFVGGPDWIKTAHFDIEARSDGSPTPDQTLEMLRTLLADRFKLVVHKDVKESPVYALTLARRDARLGPRMRPASAECPPPGSTPRAPSPEAPRPQCGFKLGNGALSGQGATMARRAGELSFVGRQVIDRTGLAGAFDVDLEWTPDTPGAAQSPTRARRSSPRSRSSSGSSSSHRLHRSRSSSSTAPSARPRTSPGQSCRRATIGLTDVARRTGIRHASAAIDVRSTATDT